MDAFETTYHMFFFKTISDLNFFCTCLLALKKQKISAFHVIQKYRLKTIYSGTNFSSLLDFRLILSITAQSIFAVEPSAWARWIGISIENFTKIKTTTFFVLLGVSDNGITQKAHF
jgi:hypothetical protein